VYKKQASPVIYSEVEPETKFYEEKSMATETEVSAFTTEVPLSTIT
jgi:hypothetical protein